MKFLTWRSKNPDFWIASKNKGRFSGGGPIYFIRIDLSEIHIFLFRIDMKDGKLLYFLRKLTSRQLADFGIFLRSPVFNQRETMVKLFEVLTKHFLKVPIADSSDKETIYQAVYPGKALNENSLKTLMTQLFGLLKDFLAFSQYKSDKVVQQRMLLKKLNQIGEQKYFPKLHSSAIKALDRADLHTSDHLYELMLLEEEYAEYLKRQPNRQSFGEVKTAVDYLGSSFLVRLLRYKIRVINHRATFTTTTDSEFMEGIIKFMRSNVEDLHWVVQVYYQLYEAFLMPDKALHFDNARIPIHDHAHKFSKAESEELYACILSLGLRQVNMGNLEFLPATFEVYREALARGFIVENGKILSLHLKNIANFGLRLGEIGWVQEFLQEWKGRILADYGNNAHYYVHGMLHYYQKEYEESERLFNLVLEDFKDPYYGLNSRGYLLQIYYETGNSIGLESLSHSFRMYLERSEGISKERRSQYVSFINHLKRLCNIPLGDSERLGKLKTQILEKDQKGMGSAWLLAKIDELLGITYSSDAVRPGGSTAELS